MSASISSRQVPAICLVPERSPLSPVQESRRKAQEELAGANKAEKAAQKTVTTLEKDLAAAAAKVGLLLP